MADTRQDVIIPAQQWVDLYTASGIDVGTAVSLYNKGSYPCVVVIGESLPTSNTMGVPLYQGAVGSYASVPDDSTGLWAFSEEGTRVLVQE